MKTAALIVAAGRGTRASSPLPKQYVRLGGVPILARTLGVFLDHPGIELESLAECFGQLPGNRLGFGNHKLDLVHWGVALPDSPNLAGISFL